VSPSLVLHSGIDPRLLGGCSSIAASQSHVNFVRAGDRDVTKRRHATSFDQGSFHAPQISPVVANGNEPAARLSFILTVSGPASTHRAASRQTAGDIAGRSAI
jgi:hypothetical protein